LLQVWCPDSSSAVTVLGSGQTAYNAKGEIEDGCLRPGLRFLRGKWSPRKAGDAAGPSSPKAKTPSGKPRGRPPKKAGDAAGPSSPKAKTPSGKPRGRPPKKVIGRMTTGGQPPRKSLSTKKARKSGA